MPKITKSTAEADPVHETEKVLLGWDFAVELAAGQEVTTATVKAFLLDDILIPLSELKRRLRAGAAFADATADVISGVQIASGDETNSKIVATFSGFSINKWYLVQFLAAVGGDKNLQGNMFVPVRKY